jgi:hypothetical protein
VTSTATNPPPHVAALMDARRACMAAAAAVQAAATLRPDPTHHLATAHEMLLQLADELGRLR